MMGVFDVRHRDSRVADPVVDYSVHGHRHAVLGQHLRTEKSLCRLVWWRIERRSDQRTNRPLDE